MNVCMYIYLYTYIYTHVWIGSIGMYVDTYMCANADFCGCIYTYLVIHMCVFYVGVYRGEKERG